MKRLASVSMVLLFFSPAFGQDVMQYHVSHLRVLAEDAKVRVLHYAPQAGSKTPMHSHPYSVVYVIKGGKVKFTLPDGSTSVGELKAGEASLRPPTTHADEALDEVESILVEIKQPGSAARSPGQALLGAWKLVSIDYASPQGPAADDVFGPNPTGLIIYDPSGWMNVQIATANRPAMKQPESRTSGGVTPEQAQQSAAALNSYYAYFGRWDFDEKTATVTHHLESSMLPWESGLTLQRQANLDGNRLTLLARYTRHGVDYVRTLVWQRLQSSDQ